MAEKLCELKKKGGGGGATQTETVLWTNSSPTSTFASQDVTLSDDINNYDYLKFTYRVTTSVADFLNYIISVSDFKKSVQNSSIQNCILGLSTDDSASHTRRIYYKTDTTVNFNNAYQLNAVTSNNATVIPTSIIGIKNMGGIRTNEKYDTLPFKSVSGNAIPTFATKGRAKAIWMPYMFQATSAHRSLMATNVNPATGEIDNDSYPWYIDTNNLNNYGQLSGFKFVVTDSSVTLTASPSSSNLYVGLTYTY